MNLSAKVNNFLVPPVIRKLAVSIGCSFTTQHIYMKRLLTKYLERLSTIAGSLINCGPVLSWMELDNRGRRLLVTEGDSCPINTPAVAAAYSVVKYTAVFPLDKNTPRLFYYRQLY
ncbi:rho GTPase-activating protein 33-like [Diaphorina citri]|uniref:Rho GTPase-activating protein 33-like n=1 Tax=Diaphorina citri TaxID=121845 RepID=A0A3Q0IKH7_DIACI|nr:rho GTPase-activating protein 33-like [Diaphorina citri]